MLHNIILIDDSDGKADAVCDSLYSLFEVNRCHRFTTIVDAIDGIQKLQDTIKSNPDSWVFIVDMQLPLYQHTPPTNPYGGYKVLRELQRMQLTSPALLVTGDSVDDDRAAKSYKNYKGHVEFSYINTRSDNYAELLKDYLK